MPLITEFRVVLIISYSGFPAHLVPVKLNGLLDILAPGLANENNEESFQMERFFIAHLEETSRRSEWSVERKEIELNEGSE